MEVEPNRDGVYQEFEAYDFNKSPSYLKTLEQVYNQYLIVLSDKDLEVKHDISNGVFNEQRIPYKDREQLQLQTRIFVFCSETDNILEIQEYQEWASLNHPRISEVDPDTPTTNDNNSFEINDTHTVANDTPPEYTSNYEQIVDMIVNNKPIPGIKKIPDTLLDPESASQSVLQHRKKPWEE